MPINARPQSRGAAAIPARAFAPTDFSTPSAADPGAERRVDAPISAHAVRVVRDAMIGRRLGSPGASSWRSFVFTSRGDTL